MEFLFKLFVGLRRHLESITWNLFKLKNWEEFPDLMDWEKLKDYNPVAFSGAINQLEYKWDPIKGLLDYSFPVDSPTYFFKDLPQGRDCDDWARIWVCYYLNKGLEVEEWVVTSKKKPFSNSHFVALVHDEDGYRLLNYRRSPSTYKTQEEALEELSNWSGDTYKKENRLQCLYKRYTNDSSRENEG